MAKSKDITGQKFGKLTALYRLHNTKGCTKWLGICDCGNLKEVYLSNLTRGNTTSCGCIWKQSIMSHGLTHSRLYHIYDNIFARCYRQSHRSYKYYGGRGITICDEWLNDKENFFKWAINNGYKDDLTIDRIDVNGNYEPNNCRWVDVATQNRNYRRNINITIDGVKYCLKDLCKLYNLNYKNTLYAYHHGKDIHKLIENNEN